MPIKVQVDFTPKSWMHCLVTNKPEDLSVNVFYNGEFVHSKLYRAGTWRGPEAEETHPNISGRRVNTGLEVPFVVLPTRRGEQGSELPADASHAAARWNEINQNLLVEADQWGREGKFDMFRTPVGEYLEELSKVPMPRNARPINADGMNIGIIDVSKFTSLVHHDQILTA